MIVETPTGEKLEIYRNGIEAAISEYIADMPDPESVKNPMAWRGCLLAVYNAVFKPSGTLRYNAQTTMNIESPDEIMSVWKLYCEVSFAYKHYISIGRFCLMCGLDKTTICNWGNGRSREANQEYFLLYKKMMSDCESCLEDMATESNGIGAIFNLKSKHNWVEKTNTLTDVYITESARQTPEQIAERYADAKRPTLPDFTSE